MTLLPISSIAMERQSTTPPTSRRLLSWVGPTFVICMLVFSRHQAVRQDHDAKRRYIEKYELEEAMADLREAAREQGVSFAPRSVSTSIPSWGTRKKTWLGLGAVEWTVEEKTLLWGTKRVVYRMKDGKAVEQPSGN